MFCRNCGNEIPDFGKFCPKCGVQNCIDNKLMPSFDNPSTDTYSAVNSEEITPEMYWDSVFRKWTMATAIIMTVVSLLFLIKGIIASFVVSTPIGCFVISMLMGRKIIKTSYPYTYKIVGIAGYALLVFSFIVGSVM